MSLKLILQCCLLLPACSLLQQSTPHSSIDGVYRGTLGQQEIVVEIGTDPERPKLSLIGRYFYRRHGIGISLKGARVQDGSYLLTEYHTWKNTGGQWKLNFQNGQATGSFCKCDLAHASAGQARQLPIQLKRVSSGFDPDLADTTEEGKSAPDQAYYDLLLDFPLTTSPETTTKSGYAYLMAEDSRFKTGLPRLTMFPDTAAMTSVNKLLETQMTKYRLEAAACLQGVAFNGGDFAVATKVELFSRHLLSVTREGMIFCGGAHPEDAKYVNTYDLDTGTETSVGDLLVREMDGKAIEKAIGTEQISGKEAVERLMAELYLHHAQPNKDCRDVIGRDETHAPSFSTTQYLSGRGLVVNADLPYAVLACAGPVVIPYGELRPLLRKDSQLFLLVDAAP
jgi:hypothetical protein